MGRSISIGKVFWEIEANTKGLEQGLASAEKSLARTSKFILAQPTAAAGALGVALLGVAAKATQMAEEVDVAFRKVGALVPDLANNLKRAQRGVAELAVVTGKSQAQLLQEAEVIAKGGVTGTTDLLNRLRVLQDLADAAGADVSALAGGLDQTLDVFSLSADKAGEVSAKLFAISQGKAPIEDLFAAIQLAAPSIRALGLDFETTAAALGTLLDQGLNAKQAGKELKALAGEGERGAAKIRELAGSGIDAADALAKLATADRLVRESASRSAASIRQGFNNELLDLGTRILPLVTAEMKGLVAIIDRLQGKGAEISTGAKVTTARVLGQELASGHLSSHDELDAGKIKQFADAVAAVRGQILLGRLDLATLGKLELEQLRQAFEQFQKLKGATAIDTSLQERITSLLALKGAPGSKPPPTVDDPVTKAKVTAAEVRVELERDLAGFTATLVDDSLLATDRFLAEMKAKLDGLSKAEQAALQPLIDQIVAGMRQATQLLRDAESFRVSVSPLGVNTGGRVLGGGKAIGTDPAVQKAKEETKAENDLATARREAIQTAAAQAQQIEQAARGALQLAESMGIMSAQAAQAAEAVVQIGAAAAQLSALSKAGTLDFSSGFSSVLSIAGGVASLIGGLVGESPEEKRHREILHDNTQAILELSRSLGVFGGRLSGTPGNVTAGVEAAARATVGSGISNHNRFTVLTGALDALGLSMADLRDVAKTLNITFAGDIPQISELKQLLDAIATDQLTARTDTFAGQLSQLQDIFEVFDITDPLEQLRKLVDLFDDPKFGSPALRKALAGLDLSTPEGRAAAEKAIQELVKRLGLAPDKGGITTLDTGGMSPEQFREALLDLEKRLDELGRASAPQGETQGFAVSRTITEAQGSLVVSQLGSVVYWQQALYDLLDHRMLAPPSIVPGALSTAGSVVDVTIYLSVTGVLDTPTATRMGADAVDGIVARLDAAMGAKLRSRKLLVGDVTRV